jgi:hypothetical protein
MGVKKYMFKPIFLKNRFKNNMRNMPVKYVQLNIQDFKMPNGLAPHSIAKYMGPYKILHKPHPDVHTLKLPINFVAHQTFHVSK